ncbi:unnamed protein product [Trichogramma brassicae]|uniref:Uncharacterized protein n=1 Tax=Trichogramma brassicae TaxID=86971 RepID=A0A6H5I3E7_9HYME|nr:unnamed protein product [Trichogramma brassicae]
MSRAVRVLEKTRLIKFEILRAFLELRPSRKRSLSGRLTLVTHESLYCVGTRVTFNLAKRLLVHGQGRKSKSAYLKSAFDTFFDALNNYVTVTTWDHFFRLAYTSCFKRHSAEIENSIPADDVQHRGSWPPTLSTEREEVEIKIAKFIFSRENIYDSRLCGVHVRRSACIPKALRYTLYKAAHSYHERRRPKSCCFATVRSLRIARRPRGVASRPAILRASWRPVSSHRPLPVYEVPTLLLRSCCIKYD